jgi:hypothetical protein
MSEQLMQSLLFQHVASKSTPEAVSVQAKWKKMKKHTWEMGDGFYEPGLEIMFFTSVHTPITQLTLMATPNCTESWKI